MRLSLLLPVLCCVCLIVSSAVAQSRYFGPPTSYPAGSNPQSISGADFNRDVTPDLAVVDYDNQVNILLGNGDGTFQPAVSYPVGQGTFLIGSTTDDFNEDGNPDLAVTVSAVGPLGGTIGLLLGNGDGTFQPPQYINSGVSLLSVTAGDLNRDQHLDFWIGGNGESSVMFGNGDGTFQAPTVYSTTTPGEGVVYGVEIADLNRDGRLDLIAANFDGTVGILLNQGGGVFGTAQVFPANATGSLSVAAGDLNSDGKIDLAVASQSDPGLSILLGNGDGTFEPATNYSGGTLADAVAITDVDNDGKLDVIVSYFGDVTGEDAGIGVFKGNGKGMFRPAVLSNAGLAPNGIVLGKFNSDRKIDVVISDCAGNSANVLLNVTRH